MHGKTQQCWALSPFFWALFVMDRMGTTSFSKPLETGLVFSPLSLTTWKWVWKFHSLPMHFFFLCIRKQLFSQAFDCVLEIFERKGLENKVFWNAKHYFYYQLKTGPLTSHRHISLIFLWFLPRWLVMPFLFGLLQLYLTMRCIIQMPLHSSYY